MSLSRLEPSVPSRARAFDDPPVQWQASRRLRTGRLMAATLLLVTLTLNACGGGGTDSDARLNPPPGGDFELVAGGVGTLVEGADDPLFVPLTLVRRNGHSRPVALSLAGASIADTLDIGAQFVDDALADADSETGLRLTLDIDALPIQPQSRRLFITASDGLAEDVLGFDVMVRPTDAPDVYLLVGQSNMVGFSGDGTRQAYPGGPDALDARIRQLNVSGNDSDSVFVTPDDFRSIERNVRDPRLVIAEDPLHLPRGAVEAAAEQNGKEAQYIGLGLSFAKRALLATTAEIVLVPAAWAGSSFCANDNGPQGNWNAGPVDSSALGNTLLFDRAVTRADTALAESGGVLRGILWHQGEGDANEACAPLYRANLQRLAQSFRERIRPDRRGADWRRADANIPMIAGTLSRGDDERGEFSLFNEPKRQVDDAIRALPGYVSHAALVNADDLVPAAGYPCGSGSCVHFGAAALREIGRRYHEQLERAAAAAPLQTAE